MKVTGNIVQLKITGSMSQLEVSGNIVQGGAFNWADYWSTRYPSGLTATIISPAQIDLGWTNNGDEDYDGGSIERSDDGGIWTEIDTFTIGDIAYSDTVTADTEYSYRIRYYKGSNYSTYSNEVDVTEAEWAAYWAAFWATRYASALSATVNSDTQVTLNWTNNGTADYTGHKAYISTDGITYTLSKTVATIETSMVITGLTGNTYYYFKIAPYKGLNIGTLTSAILKRTLYTSGTVWPNASVTLNPAAGYGYSATEIDNMLIDMATSVALISKTITLQGSSAAPTVASMAALNTLRGRGNTVITNETIGAERVTNGNFAAWTADNPDSWTVTGESGTNPMVTQVGSAARIYSSSAAIDIKQTILTLTKRYRASIEITATGGVAGGVKMWNTNEIVNNNINAVGVYTYDFICTNANFQIYRALGGSMNDATFTNVSVKEIT